MMHWTIRVKGRVGPLVLDIALSGSHRPLALIGPNGSGKSTILRILSGAHPLPGLETRVEVDGRVLDSSENGVFVSPERRQMGYVPQGSSLFPHLNVIDNVAFGWSTGPKRASRSTRRRAAQDLLVRLGCEQLASASPENLSGGERQQVALARALFIDPTFLLLDEPLSALDATRRRRLRSFLADHLKDTRTPCLLVTHDARDVQALDAEVRVLEGGKVVQDGMLQDLRDAPATDFVSEFAQPFWESPAPPNDEPQSANEESRARPDRAAKA